MRAAPKARARATPSTARKGSFEKKWATSYLETIDGEIYLWTLVSVKFKKTQQTLLEKWEWKWVRSTPSTSSG